MSKIIENYNKKKEDNIIEEDLENKSDVEYLINNFDDEFLLLIIIQKVIETY